MEQIQFIYFQYCMQYYTVHHKENSTYMEIWHRGRWFKLRPQLPVCFGFTIVKGRFLTVTSTSCGGGRGERNICSNLQYVEYMTFIFLI